MSSAIQINMSFTNKTQQSHSKQSLEGKKALLKNQIQELKRLKEKIKQSLNTSSRIHENKKTSFFQTSDLSNSQIDGSPIGDFPIKNELFNFAGIKCVKYSKHEYVFHFVVKEENGSIIYFVQFFNIDNKGELGKWTLPTFIDINWILKETPLDNIANAVQFVRNCKHYIDCYHNRMNQFITLKKFLESITNCTLDADRSYKFINIDLFGVYDVEFKNYINITVYLVYDLKEARPQQITVDSRYGAPLKKETERGLRSFLKAFRKFNLIEAFRNIEKGENSFFSWRKLERNETTLDDQDSEEESTDSTIITKQNRKRKIRLERRNISKKKMKKKREYETLKPKISTPTEKGIGEEIGHEKKTTKSKFGANREIKPPVKIGSTQNKKDTKLAKPKKVDISTFLTKRNEDRTETKLKDPPVKRNLSEESKTLKEISKSLKLSMKPSHVILKPLEGNIEIMNESNLMKAQRKDPVLEKMNDQENSKESRLLRSSTISPKRRTILIEVPPKRVAPMRKLISPKKIVLPKKLADSKRATTSKKEILTKKKKLNMKQTTLITQYSDGNVQSTKSKTIKPNHQAKLLQSKLVTSTPMPFNRNLRKRSLERNLDISEIKLNENLQVKK